MRTKSCIIKSRPITSSNIDNDTRESKILFSLAPLSIISFDL